MVTGSASVYRCIGACCVGVSGVVCRWRLDRDLPYPPEQVRSVTLLYDGGRLWVDVTAEVLVACYPAGYEPDPGRVAGVDLGIIHP
jgi:hypothetical protein